MLFQATLLVDLIAMTVCLWMAFYLFARGFPSKVTMRGVILLLSLSAFFFGAYNNIFTQIAGTAAWRATFLIIGIGAWYEITLQLLPAEHRKSLLPWAVGIYTLGLVTIVLLLSTRTAFIGEQGNMLYVARMGVGLPYILYGVFEIAACFGLFQNLLSHGKIGITSQGKFFLFSSFFPAAGVVYGIIALAISPLPRIYQDLLIFSGVFLMGISVARHQTLVERRTILQDFPVTSLTVILLALAYAVIALRLGLNLQLVGLLVAFVVLTHALYDLVREVLERLRIQNESALRKQLRQLESETRTNRTLRLRLQEGLDLLCNTLNAPNGFIAIKQGEEFVVTASRHSVENERRISSSKVAYEDISNLQNEEFPGISYFAPSFDGQTQIAVVGIGKPNNKLDYSQGDLELLSEVSDQIGTIVSLSHAQPQLDQIIIQSEINSSEASLVAEEMLGAMETNPDQEFTKAVEDGLRHLSDYIKLGQSPLAEKLGVQAESHIERGRELQKIIVASIELLRPAEKRPPEPLPRVWYNHAVLHDAYVEGVPNREIMARLYISEGTFNRTRRNAIRGLARLLMEKRTQ